jgi:hypothetical protein
MSKLGNYQNPELLTKEEIEELLPMLDDIIGWANQVKDHALQMALDGEEFENYKVVEGRSFRKITDEPEAAKRLVAVGFDEAMIYEKKLLSISKLEKLVGKKTYQEHLEDLVDKPQGKPTLVEKTDKRPAMDTGNQAAADFAEF